jgi:acetylglutamate kinase
MERLGMEVRFVEGVRVSDAETVEVAKMVLLGKVNSDIVMRLNRHGQAAVGLSGEDGTLFDISPHPSAEEIGFVGEIEHVDVDVLNHIAEDYIPVVASAGPTRRETPTTSTPTRPRARSPRRSAPSRRSS